MTKNPLLKLTFMLLTLTLLSGCTARPTDHTEPQGGNTSPPAETDDIGVQDDVVIAYGLLLEADEQFVRERYYAVCDNLIYFYDAEDDAWNVLSAG